jgi:hypothetical protein
MNSRWKVVLAFIFVFVMGGAFAWAIFQRPLAPPGPKPNGRPENFEPQLTMRWLRMNQLELTPEQKQAIRPIVGDTAEKLRRLRRDAQHNAQLLIEQMQDSVAAQLTPQQKDRFDQMIQRQRQRLNQFIQRQQAQRALEQERQNQGAGQ